MARQQKNSQILKSIVGAALVGLALVILIAKLDAPSALLTSLLGSGAREALELAPSTFPAAWQALKAYAFDHLQSSPCPLQMLVSFWPLLRILVGAA
jgi:hypothetical protein